MKAKHDKWLAASPAEPPASVAAGRLRTRLAAVRRSMRLAARRADEDPQYVHELRVSVRRAEAAVELFQEFLPRRAAAWIAKRLKQLRQAANRARDLDVLADRLRHEQPSKAVRQWTKKVAQQRAKAQRPIVAGYRRLKHKARFKRHIKQLLAALKLHSREHGAGAHVRFDAWGRLQLQPIVGEFFFSEPSEAADAKAWHEFRIHGKGLRYALELLSGAFSGECVGRLFRLISALQDKLGDMNDVATAQKYLQKRFDAATDAKKRRGFKRLAAQHEAQLVRERKAFLAWYRSGARETLRRNLRELLGAAD